MEMKEFNDMVKPYPSGDDEIIFDVRPFGARQGDAIDSYLHARLLVLGPTGIGATNKLVVLLRDATAQIPASAENWLRNLNAQGQRTEIRPAWAPGSLHEVK